MKEYSFAKAYFPGSQAEVESHVCRVPLLHVSAKGIKVFGEEM